MFYRLFSFLHEFFVTFFNNIMQQLLTLLFFSSLKIKNEVFNYQSSCNKKYGLLNVSK